ncbi:MAG TPA: GGDEF domain-containing protein [Terracidiphilus sp.]
MNWSKLPDIVAVGLLASAFASVARRNYTRVSGIWLTGWLLIVAHFTALTFVPAPGFFGTLAGLIAIASLTWAGVLFMWAAVPYREETSSRVMFWLLIALNTLYICILDNEAPPWLLNCAAILLGTGPLILALLALRWFNHRLRWLTVTLYFVLGIFLLTVQTRPGNGPDLALNGVLFTVYLACCLHFWYKYRRATTGAFITIYGFFAWACVFLVSPLKDAYFPSIQVESEVWNLPKYVVALGMILLLLEEQIEHNKHLALHDVLTGLPNRRLFQDRLAIALERARRTQTKAALLVMDLDRFKQVNDTLGHHVGDLLLQNVARVLSGRIRRSDTVARTGGDEFSVILECPTTAVEALHVGRSLQELLKEPMDLENRMVKTGASFGAALFPDDAADLESLCIAADQRMYENKRANSVSEEHHSKGKLPPAVGPKPKGEIRIKLHL